MIKQPSYATGYKKPPVEHQFKPGKSGNPKGRPRKNRDANIEAAEAFLEPVGDSTNKTGSMTPRHAGYAMMMKNALGGNRQAMAEAIDLILEANDESIWDLLGRCGLTPENLGLSDN